MTKDLLIAGLLFLCGLQGGYLIKTYVDYTHSPVPIMTENDVQNLLTSQPENPYNK